MSIKLRNRPHISYVNSPITTQGQRLLPDFGTAGKNAPLYFGRGCATDGTSQSIPLELPHTLGANLVAFPLVNWVIQNDAGSSSVTEDVDGNIVFDYVATDATYLNILQDCGITNSIVILKIVVESITESIKINDSETNNLFGVVSSVGEHYFVAYTTSGVVVIDRNISSTDTNAVISSCTLETITQDELHLYKHQDGIEVYQNITFPTPIYHVGKVDGTGAYEATTSSNYIFTKQALTPQQKEYLYRNPERFLYNDKTVNADGSASWSPKSQILNQTELDSVVAHYPMCETDDYARNMIGYSEGVSIAEDSNFDVNWTTGTESSSIGDGSIHLLSTLGDYDHVTKYTGTMIIGETYILEFTALDTTYDGQTFTINDGGGASQVLTFVGDKAIILLVALGGDRFEFTRYGITDIIFIDYSVKKLTNTTQITNYTNSVRDNAINLTTGSQTCFSYRDVLGVPIGSSFNGLQSDVVGFADTGWIPDLLSPFYIEAVMFIEDNGVYEFNGNNTTDGVVFGNSQIQSWVYTKVFGVQVHTGTFIDVYMHLGIYFDGSSVFVYHNGVEVGSGLIVSTVSDSGSIWLGGTSISNYKTRNGIPLFNVHTTPQDPMELYLKAQKELALKGITI